MKTFVCADLHLGHKKLQEIRGIPDEHIVSCWNSVVSPKDTVYVLGDVFRLDLVPAMAGNKILILGNHDKYKFHKYLECFTKIYAMKEWDNMLLTHIPVHPCQKTRYRKNIHGHLHSNKIDDPWYVCVSLEHINYTPVELDSL